MTVEAPLSQAARMVHDAIFFAPPAYRTERSTLWGKARYTDLQLAMTDAPSCTQAKHRYGISRVDLACCGYVGSIGAPDVDSENIGG